VNAFKDSESRQSIVTDTLQSLAQQAKHWRDAIDRIEAGQEVNRAELLAGFGKFLEVSQNLRDAILSEDSAASWSDKDELHALVSRLDGVAAMRARYLDLAHALSRGTVVHHRERTRLERLQLRDAAVAELMENSARATLPELPGPGADVWLRWACGLEDESNDPDLVQLQRYFSRVDDFVRQLDIKTWQDGLPTGMAPAATTTAVTPTHLDKGSGRGSKALRDEKPAAPMIATAPADFFAASATASTVEEIRAEAVQEVAGFGWTAGAETGEPAKPTPVGAVEMEGSEGSVAVATETAEETSTLHRVKGKGEISFFPEEEVECFSLYLEKAKREPEDARKVRALFAISHWLNPVDQNPASHPSCGIRSQVEYTGATDLVPSSPADASKAITTHNRLLLFTGGADLLRWSLGRPANGHFDALASVRRLSLDHIRAWFHDLYKIELADPQLQDIYRLTSGIPLLVGEMHRLIVPDADAPPAWLGFEIWTTILTNFGNRLPAIAHELSSGTAAVRLSEREIEILKMVAIASDDFATPETIVSSLMEEWRQYHHPELRELSSSDADSVAVLERLGLLPIRQGAGAASIQALSPLEPNDALRQIVRYL